MYRKKLLIYNLEDRKRDFIHSVLIISRPRRKCLDWSSMCSARPANNRATIYDWFRGVPRGGKKNDDRTKQIISLNIQQLPETDPLFNGYTGRVPIARANMLGRHSKYVFSVCMGK